MGIGIESNYGNLFQNYRMPSIQKVDLTESVTKSTPEESIDYASTPTELYDGQKIEKTPREELKLEDVSLSLSKNDSFTMVGRESDIKKLDMESVVSDMKKDNILEQYQFFVGNVQNFTNTSLGTTDNLEEDGIVILK